MIARVIHVSRRDRRAAAGLAIALVGSASFLPHVAAAQVTPATPPPAGSAGGSDARLNASPTQVPQDNAVGEVVVTAQKREQRLSDVPLKVTALSGENLAKQGVTDITQLQYSTPELVVTTGPSPAYAIRGIGTQTFTRNAASDVAVVIDGVIQPAAAPPTSALSDVQRVEVLSGPQGMLFGKNASAGVINIVTNAPDPKAFSATGHVDLGERDYRIYRGALNVPVTSDSALRVSLFSNGEGSTLRNVSGGGDGSVNAFTDYGGRARYFWDATAFKVNINADYEKNNGNANQITSRRAASLAPLYARCGVTPSTTNTDVCVDGPNSLTFENYGISGQIDVPVQGYTVTSLTADRQYITASSLDSDTVNLNFLDLNAGSDFYNQFTQEFRLASPAGARFEYVVGLYYFNLLLKSGGEQAGTLGLAPVPILLDAAVQHNQQTSYAAFGQGTLHLFRGLNAVLGARETRDINSVNVQFSCRADLGLCIPGVTALGAGAGHYDKDNFSYRVGLQYKLNPRSEAFITYTRGYKGLAINDPAGNSPTLSVVKPEIPLYLEAGYKASFFDQRLSVDVVAFHDVVKNFQAQVFDTSVTPSVFRFANASRLRSDGVQFDAAAHPVAGLTLGAGFLYNRAVYGDYLAACTAGYCSGFVNVRGNQLASAPRWSANFNAEYDHPVTSALNGYGNVTVAYRGDANSNNQPNAYTVIKAYAVVNGRLGLRTADDRYGIAIFARNLFDERFPSIIANDPVSGGLNFDQYFSRDAFRVIGISLDVKY